MDSSENTGDQAVVKTVGFSEIIVAEAGRGRSANKGDSLSKSRRYNPQRMISKGKY